MGRVDSPWVKIFLTYFPVCSIIKRKGRVLFSQHDESRKNSMNTNTISPEYAADFRIAQVFSDHMVVQRNEPIRVWGFAPATENGKKISYTKEQLLEGVDLDNLRESLPKALETNQALREVVFASMAGEMMMDASLGLGVLILTGYCSFFS